MERCDCCLSECNEIKKMNAVFIVFESCDRRKIKVKSSYRLIIVHSISFQQFFLRFEFLLLKSKKKFVKSSHFANCLLTS